MSHIRVPLKNIISIKKIVTVYCFDFAPDYKFSGESHDFSELIYIIDGEITVHHGEKSDILKAGELLCYKPNEFHALQCDSIHSAKVFIISFECNSSSMKYFQDKKIEIPRSLQKYISEIQVEAAKCFNKISTHPLIPKKDAPIGSLQFLRCSLEMFFIRLMRLEEEKSKESSVFFTSSEEFDASLSADIIRFLHNRLYEKTTLDDVCKFFHFGKSRLCHIFKSKMGTSVMKYYQGLKIEESKQLLKSGLSVTEISEKLCFDSPQHFAKVFKKATLSSPTDFKNQQASI